jgi:2'-5' RNA ligase
MDTLYTLAYPSLSLRDQHFIDAYREKHDAAFRDVVAPHFTMLFGCDSVPPVKYEAHVLDVAARAAQIRFVCRYAMTCNDVDNDNYYAFLVPEEGYSAIARLHDELYRGVMAPFLRLDAPYIPHIAVATAKDAQHILQLCSELNSKGLEIEGRIEALTVCSYAEGKIYNGRTYTLRST